MHIACCPAMDCASLPKRESMEACVEKAGMGNCAWYLRPDHCGHVLELALFDGLLGTAVWDCEGCTCTSCGAFAGWKHVEVDDKEVQANARS